MSEQFMKQKHPDEQLAIRKAVSLKAAVDFCLGVWGLKGINITPDEDLSDKAVKSVESVADKFEVWLNGTPVTSTGEKPSYPAPNLEQKKVLDEICKQTKSEPDIIYPLVLKWAKEVHNVDYYPTKMSSVNLFIDWNGK